MLSETVFFAHTTNKCKTTWQELRHHLFETAALSRDFAGLFSAGDWGEWCGVLHDFGKFSLAFQRYLEGKGESVDHSTAGAQLAVALLGRFQGSIIGYVVAGHHGGLPDGGATRLDDGTLCKRLDRKVETYSDWLTEVELPASPAPPPVLAQIPAAERGFALAFFIRMLFSCLTDADYLDTERFYAPGQAARRCPPLPVEVLLSRFDAFMARLIKEKPDSTMMNFWRRSILEYSREAAQQRPGIFSLTVPTGGGKTLSSLAFALTHARQYGMKRIIYVIPFVSIIEQSAEVFRTALGEGVVLEHHCTYAESKEHDDRDSSSVFSTRLAAENWDCPVIVTTAVQFFESLFANRPSRCRKLHNIAGSVVILDEA